MYAIQIGRRYFSARRGYLGGLVARQHATLFSQCDAVNRASSMPGAVAVAA